MPTPYEQHVRQCRHPFAQQLLGIVQEKQSNLCVSADTHSAEHLLAIADAVGPEICMLKTHIDCIADFSEVLIDCLKALAEKHRFVLFEDRKFADIGATVKAQYGGGVYRIAQWADLINAHPLPGPGMIEGLHSEARAEQALLLIAQMSAKDNLFDESYKAASIRLARMYPDFVVGFISTHRVCDDFALLHFTPGVRDDASKDALGQQYVSPHEAIVNRGTDIIIVGRGITAQTDMHAAAKHYRRLGWEAAVSRFVPSP